MGTAGCADTMSHFHQQIQSGSGWHLAQPAAVLLNVFVVSPCLSLSLDVLPSWADTKHLALSSFRQFFLFFFCLSRPQVCQ